MSPSHGAGSDAESIATIQRDESLSALDVRVSPDELAQLDAAFAPGALVGDRYPSFVMKYAAQARSGAAHRKPFSEVTPHLDGAGVIDAIGEGVDPSRVGQRVWLFMAAAGRPTGTAAEFTVVPAERAVPLPDEVSFDVGASLGVPALTAHRASRSSWTCCGAWC
ncbi:hypothetical protein WMF04_32830 [Sorangium sp. So ce260]